MISKKVLKALDFNFTYKITNDTKDPQLSKAKFDIAWLGQGEICENGYKFTPKVLKLL